MNRVSRGETNPGTALYGWRTRVVGMVSAVGLVAAGCAYSRPNSDGYYIQGPTSASEAFEESFLVGETLPPQESKVCDAIFVSPAGVIDRPIMDSKTPFPLDATSIGAEMVMQPTQFDVNDTFQWITRPRVGEPGGLPITDINPYCQEYPLVVAKAWDPADPELQQYGSQRLVIVPNGAEGLKPDFSIAITQAPDPEKASVHNKFESDALPQLLDVQ